METQIDALYEDDLHVLEWRITYLNQNRNL